MLSPIFAEVILILAIAKNFRLQMIIKSFVALGFVTKVDDFFAASLPDSIIKKASKIKLSIGKDQNSITKIKKRYERKVRNGEDVQLGAVIMNLFVNLVFFIASNFYVVFYYYFFPLLGIVIQFSLFFD